MLTVGQRLRWSPFGLDNTTEVLVWHWTLQRQAQVERRRVGAHEHIKFIEEKNLQEHNQDLTEPKKKRWITCIGKWELCRQQSSTINACICSDSDRCFRSMTCSEQVAIGTVVEMHHTDTRRHGLDSQVQFPWDAVHKPADVKPGGGGESAWESRAI